MYTSKLVTIAHRYDRAPNFDVHACPAWDALRDACTKQAAVIQSWLRVDITDDPEPCKDAASMFADIYAGRVTISRAHSNHPLWSVDDNVNFRLCHDVLGHFRAGADFSWEGENLACSFHASVLSPLANRALFTECIAQVAFWNHFRQPPAVQKIVRLDHLI